MARGRPKIYQDESSVMVNLRVSESLIKKLKSLDENVSKSIRLCVEAYFTLKEINEKQIKRGKK